MAGNPAIFIDTNILIYAKLARSTFHEAALSALYTVSEGGGDLWISRQILREYLSAMSRPNTLTTPISMSTLVEDIREFAAQFRIAEDGPSITERLLHLVTTLPVAGKQIHDANIIATMQVYGLNQLLTHNVADFERFSNQVAVIPLISAEM